MSRLFPERSAAAMSAAAILCLLGGCGDDDGPRDASIDMPGADERASDGAMDTSADDEGIIDSALESGVGVEPELEFVARYDASVGEQPVDVATLPGDRLALTFPFLNEVRIVRASDGAVEETVSIPAPIGVATDNEGRLIVTTAPGVFDPTFDPATDAADHGVSRIDSDGAREILASFPFAVLTPDGEPNPEGVLPRDAVVDGTGRIFVSDLAGGRIYVISGGSVTEWSNDPLLRGSEARPGPEGRPPFLTGVNGIRVRDGSLYACNSDFGRLVRFPILADGTAGASEVIIEDDSLLGFDEFEFSESGDILAILAFRFELVRIQGSVVEVVFGPDDGLDNPAGLARGLDSRRGELFVTNLAFITNNAGGDARPSLVRVNGALAPR